VSGRFPLISIITLNYNQSAVTVDFLKSSLDLTYPNYEILVCDMASSDKPGDIIHPELYKNTRLLLSDKNLGFAAGNNWGMNQAKGDYFFIVNNDTILTSDILERLLQPFQDNPRIGVTCPKILYHSAPDTIQYAGFAPMNRYTGRTLAIGDHEKDRGQHDQPGPTSGAHGCAMLVKREVAEDTGRFPEKFFLYYEEWDWSARLLKKGYQIWYTADARIYHKESMSVGKANPMKLYYLTRNRILYMRRNSSGFPLWVFTAFFICFSLPKTTFLFLVRGQFAHLRNFLKGAFWNLNHDSSSAL
jgi:GT2 family glycosyltransferase